MKILILVLAIVLLTTSVHGCPEVLCTLYCQYGNKLDANGCRICACNDNDPCMTVRCSAGYHCEANPTASCVADTPTCPLRKCPPCDNGYVYDKNNCQTCECYDPCKNVQCPYGQECQAKQVTCVRAPCYPVGECVALPKYVCPVYDAKAACGDKRNPFDCNPRSSACPAGSLCCGYECSGTHCETNLCEAPDRYTNCFKQETRECESAAQCGADQICCNIICGGTRCKPKTNTGSSLVSQEKPKCGPTCEIFCQYGKVLDANGCETCTCNDNPCMTVRCSAGYHCEVTQVQCLIAPCPPPTAGCVADTKPVCPEVLCTVACQYGNVVDENGCQTCNCNPDPCSTVRCSAGYHCETTQVQCVRAPCPPITGCVADASTCPQVRCAQYCEHGYVYDSNNCQTCQCYDACKNNPCTTGQKCVSHEVTCVKAPCYPVGECVPATSCPDLGNCGIRCAWGHAYDANGCELCQCYDPCQNVKCTGNQVCQGQNVQCVTTPCQAQGVCVDSDKKGAAAPQMVCPKIEKDCPTGQRRVTCADDSGCGNKKCCSTGCGYKICLPPERAGSCPEYNPALILCAVPKPGDEVDQCGTDVVCPGVQKCCESPCPGMGKRCVDPE